MNKDEILEALRLDNILRINFTSLVSGEERSCVCKQPWELRHQYRWTTDKLIIWRLDEECIEDIEWRSITSWENGGKSGSLL